MKIEQLYLDARELTRRMLEAATAQEWDTLTRLEQQRSTLIAALPKNLRNLPVLDPDQAKRITQLISEMERENSEIVEQVEVWQKHVRILLRLDRPAAAS